MGEFNNEIRSIASQVQKLVKDHGASFVDAPVSGGTMGAENATLTFMVGGSKAEYEAVKDVLEGMGQRIVHCGDHGMGQSAKLCNNMLLGITMIGVCEAMNLAIRLVTFTRKFRFIIEDHNKHLNSVGLDSMRRPLMILLRPQRAVVGHQK